MDRRLWIEELEKDCSAFSSSLSLSQSLPYPRVGHGKGGGGGGGSVLYQYIWKEQLIMPKIALKIHAKYQNVAKEGIIHENAQFWRKNTVCSI